MDHIKINKRLTSRGIPGIPQKYFYIEHTNRYILYIIKNDLEHYNRFWITHN